MRSLIAFVLVVCCASHAYALGGGTKIRFGAFGTTVRAGCGANVCASPCGVKVGYGAGGYGGCNSGYCGPQATPYSNCGSGGCGTQCATPCATCPTCPQPCNTCPQYGVRTHTNVCTDSYLPPPQPAQQQLLIAPQQQQPLYQPQLLQDQQFAPQGTRVVYIVH
jgi:hypothetical protein